MPEPATEQKRRGPGRPSNRERSDTLAATIETGLKGFAELLERRDELDAEATFAEIIKRDARRQAEWLAALADNHAGAEKAILWLFGGGSLIGAAGAFGPLISRAIDKVRLSGILDLTLGEPAGADDAGSDAVNPSGIDFTV